jgi:hypothetical protein
MKKRIRLNKTNSTKSVNTESQISLDLQQTTKPYIFNDVKSTLDRYEVFESERSNCDKYRLIVTINSFCSNILFNPLTEIIYHEGDPNTIKVIDDVQSYNIENSKIYGKKNKVWRTDMIRNTEYSREEIGYEYHPGWDIFNNHLIRNKTFKVVTPLSSLGSNDENFNTISDTVRIGGKSNYKEYKDAEVWVRTSLSPTNTDSVQKKSKHLYDYDDIMSMSDSVNNIMEDNGWFGFINPSNLEINNQNYNRLLNNHEACEFIDMYPDRTLYTFYPKYNKYQHRAEDNWTTVITYPYKSFKEHELIQSNGVNGLKLRSISSSTGTTGSNFIFFRTYCNHGLKKGDTIYLYVKKNNIYKLFSSNIVVTNVGDLKGEQKQTYFYTNKSTLIDDIIDEFGDNNNKDITHFEFRIVRVVGKIESEYYFRIFRRLPNFKRSKKNLTDEIAQSENDFNIYLKEYVEEDNVIPTFDKSTYQLAFAANIYNDNSAQITFNDGIDISHIVDNRKRPLTELYLTVVKNHEGNNFWYVQSKDDKVDYTNTSIRFSHCFTNVTAGIDMHVDYTEDAKETKKRKSLGDIHLITKEDTLRFSIGHMEYNKGKYESKNTTYSKVAVNDEFFLGDLVEFNKNECQEKVLEDVYHRFNTMQREFGKENVNFKNFIYDELKYDDYSTTNFTIQQYDLTDTNSAYEALLRPEGYYYKAHYRIPVREFGDINQAYNYTINIKETKPVLLDKVYILVQSKLPHKLSCGDTVIIAHEAANLEYEVKVVQVNDRLRFVIPVPDEILKLGITYVDFCKYINNNDNTYVLRRKNPDIPIYGEKINTNQYVWRDILRVGDSKIKDLEEYPYANGYLYINKTINFFLRRQDPDGSMGLYDVTDQIFPNDIYGNIIEDSIYNYKDEEENQC